VRQQNKDLKQVNVDLQKRLEALESGALRPKVDDTPTGSFLDNPDQHLEARDKRLVEQAVEAAVGKIKGEHAAETHRKASMDAESWLLSQEEIKADPDAADEIAGVIEQNPELAKVARVSPMTAVKMAHMQWRESKGLSHTRTQEASTSAARASGSPSTPTGAPASGKIWTAAEIRRYGASLDSKDPKIKEKHAEIVRAYKEGRVK
jgi:hypothetical protein